MKTLVGMNGRTVRRRWAVVDRLARVSLARDRFAETPGATLPLWLAERTHYRASAVVLDEFARPDGLLGTAYQSWGTPAGYDVDLEIVNEECQPPVTDGSQDDQFQVRDGVIARDQWAELTIRALLSTAGDDYASVGVALRMSEPGGSGDGYVIEAVHDWDLADPVTTWINKITAGVSDFVANVVTPWRVGDVLRATASWDTLRVYRNGVLIMLYVDPTPHLVSGLIGIEGYRVAGGLARLDDFMGGPLRQEYTGLVVDMGDVQASLGLVDPSASPVSFGMTLSNLGRVGGAERFSHLIRHGLNQGANTYEIERADVRVLTAFEGGSAPLVVGHGQVNQIAGLSEETISLECLGRDAFLTPLVEPGVVAYLATAGLPQPPAAPADPCAASPTPTVIPGPAPSETTDLGLEGCGPEDIECGQQELLEPLLGTWQVFMEYNVSYGGGPLGEDVYSGTTTAIQQLPPGEHDNFWLQPVFSIGSGSFPFGNPFPSNSAFPDQYKVHLMYRGPDVGGTDLVKCATAFCAGFPSMDQFLRVSISRHISDSSPPAEAGLTIRLARYDASGIHTVADLQAIRPKNPGNPGGGLPGRIETVAQWSISSLNGSPSDPGYSPTFSDGFMFDSVIPTNQFIGPQLLILEIHDGFIGVVPANSTISCGIFSAETDGDRPESLTGQGGFPSLA